MVVPLYGPLQPMSTCTTTMADKKYFLGRLAVESCNAQRGYGLLFYERGTAFFDDDRSVIELAICEIPEAKAEGCREKYDCGKYCLFFIENEVIFCRFRC